MKTKLSIYIPIHNHPGFFDLVLASCVGVVDEVVIVDGCFAGMVPWFEILGVSTEISCQETLDIIEAYQDKLNIKYFSGVWEDEWTKRAFGFNQCTHDLIFTVDSDEPFILYLDKVEEFVRSGKWTATCGDRAPLLEEWSIDWDSHKMKMFNRAVPHTIDHEKYCCVVPGYTHKHPWEEVFMMDIETFDDVGWICHLTHIRPPEEQYTRSLMYYSINKSVLSALGFFGTDLIKAMGSEVHKRAYTYNYAQHSAHNRTKYNGRYGLVPSKDFKLYDIATTAYGRFVDAEEDFNILDIRDEKGIPIVYNITTKLNVFNLHLYNHAVMRLRDQVSSMFISIQHRVLNGNTLENVILPVVVSVVGKVSSFEIPSIDNIEGEIVKSFLVLVPQQKEEERASLFTYIENVEFIDEKVE